MITIDLIKELKKEIENLFKDDLINSYETKGENKRPKVNTGWYNRKIDKEDFPYILISPVNQKENLTEAKVDLILIIGSYSKDDEGWEDTALIAEKIRSFLRSHKYIAKKYEIGENLEIEYPDEQPYPISFCAMKISFNIYNPYNYEGGQDTWQ